MASLTGIGTPMPFCMACGRFMTPAQASAHTKHARLIRWPRK